MLRIITALAKISKLSSIHPLEKLILALVPLVIIGFARSPVPVLFNVAFFIMLHIISKNSMRIAAKFTFAMAGFAFISSVTFIFDYGVGFIFVLVLKSLSGGLCLSYLALTTPMDDILYLISRVNGLRDVSDLAKNMERFLILIEDEYHVIYYAIKARGGFDCFKNKIRNTGKMAGILFINTIKRWSHIKDAINSRCYKGHMPYLSKKFNFSLMRFAFICVYNFILIILVVYIKVF
jgi:cobalt/nickel transport system permease protein